MYIAVVLVTWAIHRELHFLYYLLLKVCDVICTPYTFVCHVCFVQGMFRATECT